MGVHHAIRPDAVVHILGALDQFVDPVLFLVTGIDCDSGREFFNHALIDWVAERALLNQLWTLVCDRLNYLA